VLRDQKEGKGKGKTRTTALIPFNHNLPDWVVSYFATGYEPGEWVARISMVVEAKPAKEWDIVSGTTTYALVLIPIALISLMAEPCPPSLNDHLALQAMSQIIVYMAKALLMDGCAMGLVVAGTEYRYSTARKARPSKSSMKCFIWVRL
jgi:hypothetical protein